MSMNESGITIRDDGTVVSGASSGVASSSVPAGARELERDNGEKESLGELFGAATRDFSELVRKEMELAKVELKEEAVTAGRAGALMGAGGLLANHAILILFLAIAWLLAEVMPVWAGLLIVAVVVGIVAAALAVTGKKKLADLTPPVPNTVETLQEDAQWAKQQLS